MHTEFGTHTSSFVRDLDDLIAERASEFRVRFIHATKFYALFHVIFGAVIFIEILAFLLFFSFFSRSTLLAASIAVFFLTGFVYFLSRFYFEAKKNVEFSSLKEEMKHEYETLVSDAPTPQEKHMLVARAMAGCDESLRGLEKFYYPHSSEGRAIDLLIQKFSTWCHWKDVLLMRELFMEEAIAQAMEWIKSDPLDAQPHALLVQLRMSLYRHYIPDLSLPWIPSGYSSQEMQNKMRSTANAALEELKILTEFSPHDPWVFLLKGALHKDLNESEQEIEAYDRLCFLQPSDSTHLLRLGTLFFQHGHAAKGLKIYQQLKSLSPEHAEELLKSYNRTPV